MSLPSVRPPLTTRVVKRLAPHQPGAMRHAKRFGDRLVCVRYRLDPEAQRRYTTVELIVDEGPTRGASTADVKTIQMVALRLALDESSLRRSIKAHGGLWDNNTRLWYVRLDTAKTLGLMHRIV